MKKLILPVVAILMLLFACEDDKNDIVPMPQHEEEVITTLIASFEDVSDKKVYTFKFSDPDGDGGNNGVVTTDTLPANSNFTVSLQVLNESVTPTDTITMEIAEEAKEHQFFYSSITADSATGITVMYNDKDVDNNPIGLIVTATTKAAGNGTLKVTLRHEPNKSATNVASGDITNAGGETDIEIDFDYVIK